MWNSKTRLPPVYSYGLVIFTSVAATMIAALLWQYLQFSPYMIYIAAVTLSAWRGGLGPGLACGLLSIIAVDFFLLEPVQMLPGNTLDLFRLVTFSLITVLISVLQESRLRTEQTLLNIKEELEVILNGVTDGITAQSADGQTIFANEAAAVISGQQSSKDIVAPPVEELRQRFQLLDENGQVVPVSQLPRSRVLAEHQTVEARFRMNIKTTGEDRWIFMKSSPVFDKRGQVRLVVNIFRDVTERYKLLEVQKQTEDRLRKVLDTIATFVGVMTPEGILIEANRSALAAANLEPEDVLDKPFYEAYWWSYSEESKDRLKAAINRAKNGEIVRYDVRIRLGENKYILIDFTLAPVYDVNGNIEYLIPSGIDVNERTRLSMLLVQEQQRLKTILNNIPGVVFEGSGQQNGAAQRVSFVSDYAEKMLGYAPENWANDPAFWKNVIHPDDWDDAIKQATKVYESGKPGILRFRCITQDKRVIHIESHTTVLINDDGEAIGTCGVMMDMTQQKSLESRLEAQAEELKRSNKDLEQFAYVASHDLQEPLRMVTSYLQLIEQRYVEKLDDDAREFIDFAVDGASRMKRLINDLLTYSRVQRDQSDYAIVDTNGLLKRVLDNLQLSIEDSGATITWDDDLPTLEAQEGQMMQLFQNLIGNALKFRRDEPLKIHIGAKRQGRQWCFSVADNGIGIQKEYLDRIFIIFQRLHTPDKYSGTGIGLAICKKVVENHDGRIWVESTPGEGTTFYFTLPAREKRSVLYYASGGSSGNITG